MSGHGDEPELTKAVPLVSDATGVIPVGTSDSKVFLDDVTVSRKHASVSFVGSDWMLSDSGSLNGTYVNKHRVTTIALVNGDELQIGKFRFVFVLAPTAGQ